MLTSTLSSSSHSSHSAAPSSLAQRPGGQSKQPSFSTELNLPAGQSIQAVPPVSGSDVVPAGHDEHVVERFPAATWPSSQGRHGLPSFGEALPGGHALHVSRAAFGPLPAGQRSHFFELGRQVKEPSSHRVHSSPSMKVPFGHDGGVLVVSAAVTRARSTKNIIVTFSLERFSCRKAEAAKAMGEGGGWRMPIAD